MATLKKIPIIGGGTGAGGATPTATCELYNPVTGLWEAMASMGTARRYHGVVQFARNKIMAAGGWGPLSSAEIYDIDADTWTATGAMTYGRDSFILCTFRGGKVLAAGKSDTPTHSHEVDIYDPVAGTWALATGSLQGATGSRDDVRALAMKDGRVLITGGYDVSAPVVYADIYDPTTNAITPTGDMITARSDHAMVRLQDGRVMVCGGKDGSWATDTAEIYDPVTGLWTQTSNNMYVTTPSASDGYYECRAVRLLDGRVVAVGGFAAESTIYNPDTDTWASAGIPFPPNNNYGNSLFALLPDGTALQAGGGDFTNPRSGAAIYTPDVGWTATASLGTARMRLGNGPSGQDIFFPVYTPAVVKDGVDTQLGSDGLQVNAIAPTAGETDLDVGDASTTVHMPGTARIGSIVSNIDTKPLKGTWQAGAVTVNFAARPGQFSTTRQTLQDGKQRVATGTLAWAKANGIADLGYDEAGSQGNTKWLYFYEVPSSTNDDLLTVVASDNPAATGPAGYTNFRCIWKTYIDGSGNLLKVFQKGNEFEWSGRQQVDASTAADGSPVAVNVSGFVPVGAAKTLFGWRQDKGTGAGLWIDVSYWADGESAGTAIQNTATNSDSGTTGSTCGAFGIAMPTSTRQIYKQRLVHGTANVTYYRLWVTGWVDEDIEA